MNNKSFTLIELLVVIVIIGILAGVIMISTSSSIDKANFAKAQAFSSTVQNELLLDLISEWTFDEPEEGGKTKDTWGNNHGTIVGATQIDDCVFGRCYSFDGNDFIDCGKNIKISNLINSNYKTISVWANILKASSGSNLRQRVIFLPKNLDNTAFGIAGDSDNKIYGYYRSTADIFLTLNSNEDFTISNWKHICLTQNKTTIKIYVNGVEKNSANNAGIGNNDNTANIIIGSYDGANGSKAQFFNGLIDDFRIYNAALSSAQIKQNYIAGLNSMLANGNISKEDYNERINNLAYNDNNE